MKTYMVKHKVIMFEMLEVEANSEEEAKQKVSDGEYVLGVDASVAEDELENGYEFVENIKNSVDWIGEI